MTPYEEQAYIELQFWQLKMQQQPSFTDRLSQKVQHKINHFIPEKVHQVITVTIEKMVKTVLFGARYTTKEARMEGSLQLREAHVKQQIEFYKKTAGIEGAITGAGGFLMGLAEFPVLIGIKLKLLFEIAALYGFDVKDYKERIYILYIFQIAFSSQQNRNKVYKTIADWEGVYRTLPADENEFDWRSFQQEYRDYIDLAKMAQLIPVIGAAVGAIANYQLLDNLGEAAMNCYRMRASKNHQVPN